MCIKIKLSVCEYVKLNASFHKNDGIGISKINRRFSIVSS